jgi:ribose 5-phosphate isomerase A
VTDVVPVWTGTDALFFQECVVTQDELKAAVGQAAVAYVVPGTVVGVGTGSTVNHFIDALGRQPGLVSAAISSSLASTARLQALGIAVLDANAVDEVSVYVDGADEITRQGYMIKGGGAALTREKIVAAQARQFVCIADESKLVRRLGAFAIPVEVIPMSANRLIRQFKALGGLARVRMRDGLPLITDNGQHILDVSGMQLDDPLAFEQQVSQWPGVVTVGVFAVQRAHVCLLGTAHSGVQTLTF